MIFTQHLLLLKINYMDKLIIPIYLSLVAVELSLVFVTPLYSNHNTPSHPAAHLLPMITVGMDISEFHKV